MTTRARIIAAGLAGASFALGLVPGTPSIPVLADGYPAGYDGCAVTAPGENVANPAAGPSGGAAGSGNVVNKGTCSFTAKKTGGFTAVGTNWNVTVYDKADPGTRKVLGSYTTANRVSSQGIPGAPKLPTPCKYPAYQRGNFVVVTTADGAVTAGPNEWGGPLAGPVNVPPNSVAMNCDTVERR